MRVVVAPDKFAGTLTAPEAAAAIASGWRTTAPDDQVLILPLSDGGPGFLDAIAAAHGGVARDGLLRVGGTAYVESAVLIGLGPGGSRDPEHASSAVLGRAIRAAVERGARRLIVGLGGTGTNDGGAGLLAALGATCGRGHLESGPAGLEGIDDVNLEPAREVIKDVEIVIASDVDNPLTGLFGATRVFGPQKGLAEERLPVVDGWLQDWAAATDRGLATAKGAGAAGGVGFALMLLGGRRVAGLDVVAEACDLDGALADADLIITGEGSLDFSSAGGKVPTGVAARAGQHGVPCIALAGAVHLGTRELRALGIEAAYSLVDAVGTDRATAEAAAALIGLAARVARTWSF